jgi:hypothetical protein
MSKETGKRIFGFGIGTLWRGVVPEGTIEALEKLLVDQGYLEEAGGGRDIHKPGLTLALFDAGDWIARICPVIVQADIRLSPDQLAHALRQMADMVASGQIQEARARTKQWRICRKLIDDRNVEP